ncbi:MAG: proprotein convertase, P, partial [Pseudomonadota bacterium]
QFDNRTQTATTVLTLPTAVPSLQFTVFDVDFAANDFADKLTVTGSFEGSTVMPTLTNGTVNYVIGNVAIGDGGSGGTAADGNVVVTFSSPVDTVTIVYGNANTAPANPDGQAISIHDFNFCNPETSLSVTKISTVISDPVSIVDGTSIPKSIPGAIVQYCILITNSGSATATDIVATDNLIGTYTYTLESMQSGSNCNAAATVEDDDASDGAEGDGITASVVGTLLTANISSLGPSASSALTFRVTVD